MSDHELKITTVQDPDPLTPEVNSQFDPFGNRLTPVYIGESAMKKTVSHPEE